MKVCGRMAGIPPKIGLFLLGISIYSCNTLKRVEEDQLLLTQYEILADSLKITDPDVNSLVYQKPNSKVLGFPLRLHLYNLAKKDADSSYQAWLERKEKRRQRLVNFLSEKQVDRLGNSFLVSGYSQWLKRVGEAPVLVDSSRTERGLRRLEAYYFDRGYFDKEGRYEVEKTGDRRAQVRYQIDLGDPYAIDTLGRSIASPALDSLYLLHKGGSLVRQGDQYDTDHFTGERERLTNLFRNSGVWNFQESSITFDILLDTLNRQDQRLDVTLNIDNLRSRGDSITASEPYRVRRMGDIHIYPDHSFGPQSQSLDSIQYENYTLYYDGELRYRPKALTDAIFLARDSVYRDIDRLRTYRRITSLNTFRYPNIELLEAPGDRLDANIYLTSRPKNSLSLDFDVTHSNIRRLGVGLGTALITRNVFKGAETLSLSVNGSFGLLRNDNQGEDFFSEIGGEINLIFPRIWMMPFVNTDKIIPYYMLPQTRLRLGTSFQKNLGLDKQTFNSIMGFSWQPDEMRRNQFEILNVEFVRNLNPGRFFNVYQSTYARLNNVAQNYVDNPAAAGFFEPSDDPENPLQLSIPEGTSDFTEAVLEDGLAPVGSDDYTEVRRVEERRQRLTEDNLIFTSNYTWTKNTKTDINDNNFYQFRWKIEGAGNFLSSLSKLIPFDENDSEQRLVFGVPYSQYVKTEVDYIRHWAMSGENVLAFRSFVGIAIPYGNSQDIPFVRSYFAGGSNDNRAWFPYSLGPGRTENLNDFNEANFKIALNLEYRFPVVGDLKGAFFSDLGNIWNIWDSEDNPEATFTGLGSLEDIALGTGFGLRYDFTYFVFRADLGFKTYNPADPPSKRWFRAYNFANSVLQIGINYPF